VVKAILIGDSGEKEHEVNSEPCAGGTRNRKIQINSVNDAHHVNGMKVIHSNKRRWL
jgi:hypothetical protein